MMTVWSKFALISRALGVPVSYRGCIFSKTVRDHQLGILEKCCFPKMHDRKAEVVVWDKFFLELNLFGRSLW